MVICSLILWVGELKVSIVLPTKSNKQKMYIAQNQTRRAPFSTFHTSLFVAFNVNKIYCMVNNNKLDFSY